MTNVKTKPAPRKRATAKKSPAKAKTVEKVESTETARLAEVNRQNLERQRISDEEAARKSDEMHRDSIHRAILQALVTNDIDQEVAKKMIRLAAKGLLPQLTIGTVINYGTKFKKLVRRLKPCQKK